MSRNLSLALSRSRRTAIAVSHRAMPSRVSRRWMASRRKHWCDSSQ